MPALSFDDIAYAMENTVVLHEPDRLIDTFGTTNFQFHLLTEPMDSVGKVRVREGRTLTAGPQGPKGESASAYQTSPRYEPSPYC